jgi:predicted GNAT family acetyltransferase
MPSLLDDPEAYAFAAQVAEDERKKLGLQSLLGGIGGLLEAPVSYVKERATALATDPIGDMRRTIQGTMDRAKAREQLQQIAYGDPTNPLRVTDQAAADQLAQDYLDMASTIMPAGMTVFHGSPYKFNAFDPTKIGSGEGAQAYGYGHYVAENPSVAKEYQSATSRDKFLTSKGFFEPSQLEHLNVKAELRKGDLDKAIETAKKYSTPDEDYPEVAAKAARDLVKLQELKASGGIQQNTGNIYQIDLPDEQIAKMLNWDEELGKQTPEIQELAKQYGLNMDDLGGDLIVAMDAKRAAGAEAMRQAGIPGIKYLDEGSRGLYKARTTYKGKPYGDEITFSSKNTLDDYIQQKQAEGFGVEVLPGTSNFVVFPKNEGLLNILERNDEPIAQGGLLGQTSKSLSDIENKFKDVSLDLYEKNNTINLSRIVVPKDMRNSGVGTDVMQDLISYADQTGQKVALTPSSDFGGNVKKLKEFYKRFGFVENKGKNKDFTTRESMIRFPQ